MLSFLELTEEHCFRHAYVFHPWDMASSAQLCLRQDGLYAGQAGSLEGFFIWHAVLPSDAKDGAQGVLVTVQVAWSAPARELRSLHHTGWEEWWRLCKPGSFWRGGVNDSATLSLTVFQKTSWLLDTGCTWTMLLSVKSYDTFLVKLPHYLALFAPAWVYCLCHMVSSENCGRML